MSTSAWKGKARAIDDNFDDLNPTITYRHILSQNLGIRDPLRVVALCDSDAFYAACEMVRLGISDKPLVVLQWESLIAVNYPARKFGISRMDKLKDAKQRCPELVVVHVATFKEGEKEPGYWDNVDSRTHKVRPVATGIFRMGLLVYTPVELTLLHCRSRSTFIDGKA